MEYNKQVITQVAHPTISKKGKRFVLLALFGGASFYGISAFAMMAYDILMKMIG